MTAPTRKKPDPVLIFLQAEGFSRAYNMLVNQPHISKHDMSTIGYPVIVLSAFAIELYLKCLICIETEKAPHGHYLKQLFDRLEPETRRRICGIWNTEVIPHRSALWDAIETNVPEPSTVSRDLPQALAAANKAFETVRYVYEGNNDGVVFILSDLPTVLHRVILEKRPLWRNVRRKVQPGGEIRKAG